MTVETRVQLQTAVRIAAAQLLRDYAEDMGVGLQVYRARPASIFPPCAFVDRMRERIDYYGPLSRERVIQADVIVIHGLFDSGDAVDQKDAFVDGFVDWCLSRYHAASDNSIIAVRATEDDPNYVPDWIPPKSGLQPMYYATLMQLEVNGD